MKKTVFLYVLALCSTYSCYADEVTTVGPNTIASSITASDTTEPGTSESGTNDPSTNWSGTNAPSTDPSTNGSGAESGTLEPSTEQLQKPCSIIDAFNQFAQKYIFILTNEQIKNKIKSVEEMLTTVIQTAFKVIQNSTLKIKEIITRSEYINTDMQDEMAEIVTKQAKIVRSAKPHSDEKQINEKQKNDPQTEENDRVLAKFAGIAQHFFNIAKDPENAENVAPNLIGMLEGIVSIGAEVMKGSNLKPDSDLHEIEEYVAQLDDKIKQDILSVIIKRKQQSDITMAA